MISRGLVAGALLALGGELLGCRQCASSEAPTIGPDEPKRIVTLVDGVDVRAMALEGGRIYFGDTATIASVSEMGGVVTTLAKAVNPADVAVGGGAVYWVGNGHSWVGKVPVGGGDVTPIAAESAGPFGDVAVANGFVYWSTYTALMKQPLSGGAAVEALPARNIVWMRFGPTHLVTLEMRDASHFIHTARRNGERTGVELAEQRTSTREIVADDLYAYWIGGGEREHELVRIPLAGGTPEVLASGLPYWHPIAVDETSLYWVTESGDLKKLPKGGGAAATLCGDARWVASILVDDRYLFVGTMASAEAPGRIRRVSKIVPGPAD